MRIFSSSLQDQIESWPQYKPNPENLASPIFSLASEHRDSYEAAAMRLILPPRRAGNGWDIGPFK